VVGWATADHLRTDLVAQALTNAVAARRPTGPVTFHSDRGNTPAPSTPGWPTSSACACRSGVAVSAGTVNAVAESFFATIKTELLDRQSWPTRAHTHKATFTWTEGRYNTRRRHSTLDYLSPAANEARSHTATSIRKVA
jgi:transposase InsO family protein